MSYISARRSPPLAVRTERQGGGPLVAEAGACVAEIGMDTEMRAGRRGLEGWAPGMWAFEGE